MTISSRKNKQGRSYSWNAFDFTRDLISLRTKEALANKRAQGIQLGNPKGTIQKSKFDNDLDKIKELLNLRLLVRKIAFF